MKCLVVTGRERGSVIAAVTRIKTIIDLNRGEQPACHFLAIPLACQLLTESFELFKKEVLKINVSSYNLVNLDGLYYGPVWSSGTCHPNKGKLDTKYA